MMFEYSALRALGAVSLVLKMLEDFRFLQMRVFRSAKGVCARDPTRRPVEALHQAGARVRRFGDRCLFSGAFPEWRTRTTAGDVDP